jgi:hypothetical protein
MAKICTSVRRDSRHDADARGRRYDTMCLAMARYPPLWHDMPRYCTISQRPGKRSSDSSYRTLFDLSGFTLDGVHPQKGHHYAAYGPHLDGSIGLPATTRLAHALIPSLSEFRRICLTALYG